MSSLPILPMSEVETGYYLRLRDEDKPGFLADVTRILADQGISIDAMLQREPAEGEGETDIIILTHVCKESCADAAHRVPHLAFQPDAMSTNLPILPMSEVETGYYLRLRVEDKPGVLADITRILADQGISIDAMLQREPEEGEGETDIIILTHVCKESSADAAIAKIEGLSAQKGKVKRIRLEELQ